MNKVSALSLGVGLVAAIVIEHYGLWSPATPPLWVHMLAILVITPLCWAITMLFLSLALVAVEVVKECHRHFRRNHA